MEFFSSAINWVFSDERLLREAAVASGPNSPAGAVTSCQTAAAVTAPNQATAVNPAAAAAVAALYSSGNHTAAAALFPQLCLVACVKATTQSWGKEIV